MSNVFAGVHERKTKREREGEGEREREKVLSVYTYGTSDEHS